MGNKSGLNMTIETNDFFLQAVKEIKDLKERKRVLQGVLRKGMNPVKRKSKQLIAGNQHTGNLWRSIQIFNSKTGPSVQVGAKARRNGANAKGHHLTLFVKGTNERKFKNPKVVNIGGRFYEVEGSGKMPPFGNFLEKAFLATEGQASRKILNGLTPVLKSRFRSAEKKSKKYFG
jgi:hypothetical protein